MYKAVLHILKTAALAAVTILLAGSCGGGSKNPDPDFATYVKAYTGGIISEDTPIRIELTGRVEGVEEGKIDPKGLFSFTPHLDGMTRWVSTDAIEFMPDEGSLKPGKTYKGTFKLGRVMKVGRRRLKNFPLRFMVAPKRVSMEIDGLAISSSTPEQAAIRGRLIFSDAGDGSMIRKMLKCSEADSSDIETMEMSNSGEYAFTIYGIKIKEKERKVGISLNLAKTDYKADEISKEVLIPSDTSFKVIGSRLVKGSDPYVEVSFSKPLDPGQDLSGLVTAVGPVRCWNQVEDNIIRIFYESPSSSVEVWVSDALLSDTGKRLGSSWSKTFSVGAPLPYIKLLSSSGIMPDSKKLYLPFAAANLKAVDIRIIKIFEDNVMSYLQENDLGSEQADGLRRAGRLVYENTMRLDGDPSKDLHKKNIFSIDLGPMFKKEPGAIYRIRLSFKQDYYLPEGVSPTSDGMLEMKDGKPSADEEAVWDEASPDYYGDYEDYDWSKYNWDERDDPTKPTFYMDQDNTSVSTSLMSSNVGIIAKYTDAGDRLWVATTNLLTGKPMYAVDIDVYNYQLRRIGFGKTDNMGLEEVKLSGRPFLIVAKRYNTKSYLKVTPENANSVSKFDVGGKKLDKGLKAFIYGDRGVWRPGDTLFVTAIVYDRLKDIPDNHPASLEVYTPEGQFYSKQIRDRSVNGFYTFAIPTSPKDPTGKWNAYVKIGSAAFHKSLQVETLRPNRLKINVAFASKVLQGGSAEKVSVSSEWLTGPAASSLEAKAEMTLTPLASPFHGYEDYTFSNPASSFRSAETSLFTTRLNAEGKATLESVMPKAAEAPGMLNAEIVCSVMEEGGQASYTTLRMPYSPFSAYVGVKLPSGVETDTDNSFKVAVLGADGKRVSGHHVEYRIYKLAWNWWWDSSSDSEDLGAYTNGTAAEAYESGSFISGSNDFSIPFRVNYPEWGRFLVYLRDTDSGHASGGIVLADWPSSRGRSNKVDPTAISMLAFNLDKKSYRIGETATVFIPAAVKGMALVSIENSTRVIWRDWVKVSSDQTYKFTVSEDMAPNFYVHVTMVQPYFHSNDLPLRLYGVQPVLVDDPSSHLEPVITMPDVVRPQQSFDIKITEKNRKQMTYTLAIVDEGLLDLTAFKTPDPWAAMYEREALGIYTADLYDKVVGAYTGVFDPMFSVGGDQGLRGAARRDNRFNPVVKFLGPFTLSSGGDTHHITLPMYVGSVRVMVVAGHGNAFGNASKTVPVRSPLMILPTLPSSLGTGEEVTLPVNVIAMEKDVKEASVSVSVEGPLKVSGSKTQSVKIGEQGDKLLRFSLITGEAGHAKVTVSASGGSHKASQTIDIEVRNTNPQITSSTSAMIPAGKSKTFDYGSSAVLEASSFPILDFDAAFSYMKNYRYSCSEQLAAKGLNAIYTMDFLPGDSAEEAKEAIPVILKELYSRQLSDGGFAYWPLSTNSDTWVTSMIGQFMTAAEAKGFEVENGVLNGWFRFQGRNVLNYRSDGSRARSDLDQAYRLYTLALANKADAGAMNRLRGSEKLSLQARWMLASAYALCGKKDIASKLVSPGEVEPYTDPYFYGSALRDKAIETEALTLCGRTGEALRTAASLTSAFSGGYSTQELAFASVAAYRLAAVSNKGALSLDIAGKKIGSPKAVFSTALSGTSALVRNESAGPVYVTVSSKSRAAAGTAVPAAASGLRLSVTYTGADGSPVNPASLRQGTDFTAVISVTSTTLDEDYRGLALRFGLPSGWEISNDRMAGRVVPEADSFTYNDIRDDSDTWFFDLDRGLTKKFTVRLRAAYEGRFHLPAVTCEAMYDGRVHANTASGSASVTR